MALKTYPRIVLAGLSGDSGKTILTCGLAVALRKKGLATAVYKKGPDYIDPMWLSIASKSIVRNLDAYMMDKETIVRSFTTNSVSRDISLIEGNRGLYDGLDSSGTYSTAELAKILDAPVILVINPKKVTRTVAAFVLGCIKLDENVKIKGVILNQISGRHLDIVKESIEKETGVPVLGAVPQMKQIGILPSRHLGLITPYEYEQANQAMNEIAVEIETNVDLDKLIKIANNSSVLEYEPEVIALEKKEKIKIGYLYDNAFCFYYPENLEALEMAGAELIKISSLEDNKLPDIFGLYIGGGFPETNIKELTQNREMMIRIKEAAELGMPIYAECGGLIYLANSIEVDGKIYEMCKVLPINLEMHKKPQGHGYCEAVVTQTNNWYEDGEIIRGHEFHYSAVNTIEREIKLVMNLNRGTGILNKKDGIIYKNTFASYLHIHSNGAKNWASKFIDLAYTYKDSIKVQQ